MGELNVASVTIKNGFVSFVNSFSFCLIQLETFLEEKKCARFGDISPEKETTHQQVWELRSARKEGADAL